MSVTLKDIAKACGVSFSTVSKALKGSSEISGETINFVRETARKMGYQPNLAARILRTNRSFDIGVVFEDSTGSGLQHQYFAKIFDSLNVAANLEGYNITFLNSAGKNKKSYLEQAFYRGFDGIVIASTNYQDEDIQNLIKSEIPVSMLDYDSSGKKASVLSDNYDGMTSLLNFIISQNHKKIAYIHGEESDVTSQRIQAYKDVLEKNHIELNPDFLKSGQYHKTETSAKITGELLSLPEDERPTCIVYPDDFAYLGGLKTLLSHSLVPGKNISVAGYDGILLSSLISPPLATYEQNAEEIGRLLIKNLLSQIQNENQNDKNFAPVYAKGKLLKGESVKKL